MNEEVKGNQTARPKNTKKVKSGKEKVMEKLLKKEKVDKSVLNVKINSKYYEILKELSKNSENTIAQVLEVILEDTFK